MPIPVLSFFTGAGLLDLGMHQAGFDVIWRNEYHEPFVKGFQYGFSKFFDAKTEDFAVCGKSITDISPYSIRNEAFYGKHWPEAFGVIGGPPCPDFSVAGNNHGRHGDNGKLTGVFFDQIDGLQPAFFVFENVKGILSNHRNREYLTEQIFKLTKNYIFDIKLLNSLDFGVPQDRERVIIIGFHRSYLSDIMESSDLRALSKSNGLLLEGGLSRKSFNENEWFSWPHLDIFNGAKSKYVWPTTNPFGNDIEKPKHLPVELCVERYLKGLDAFANQDEFFTPKSDKFLSVDEGDVSRKSFKRLHRWRYSPTAAYGNNEVHLHPSLARRLSVREAMRIQTIPDEYELPSDMTLSNKFKTIGNGVPVKMANVIATEIAQVFKNKKLSVGV